jgi:hypothetical protein
MASASLNRMTVPLGSDQSSSVQGLLMPKLKYRFRVFFENFGVSATTTELTKQQCTTMCLDQTAMHNNVR